jgi:hypothetical protein
LCIETGHKAPLNGENLFLLHCHSEDVRELVKEKRKSHLLGKLRCSRGEEKH